MVHRSEAPQSTTCHNFGGMTMLSFVALAAGSYLRSAGFTVAAALVAKGLVEAARAACAGEYEEGVIKAPGGALAPATMASELVGDLLAEAVAEAKTVAEAAVERMRAE